MRRLTFLLSCVVLTLVVTAQISSHRATWAYFTCVLALSSLAFTLGLCYSVSMMMISLFDWVLQWKTSFGCRALLLLILMLFVLCESLSQRYRAAATLSIIRLWFRLARINALSLASPRLRLVLSHGARMWLSFAASGRLTSLSRRLQMSLRLMQLNLILVDLVGQLLTSSFNRIGLRLHLLCDLRLDLRLSQVWD